MPKADRDARDPGRMLARILDTPHLARAIPRLPPAVLHHVIQSCGLEDCAELVALATPEQLAAVFDLDLWTSATPGAEEQFDAARFAMWLDVLAESGTGFAAQKISEMDPATVVAALTRYIAVFDLAAVDEDHSPSVLKEGVSCEVGGYIVAARRQDSWDTIVGVLLALDEQHPDCFHRVMRGCRRLSNSTPELDGFHDLMTDPEQARFDLAFDRERRREKLGYISAEQAHAFLQSSRQTRLGSVPPPHPLFSAYFRPADEADADFSSSEQEDSAVAAVVDVLLDAGVVPERPRALLGAASAQPQRLARIQQHLQFVSDHDPAAHELRSQELAFLANVLVAGGSVQGRPFTAREAFDAAVAICNLGLENWPQELPDDFLAEHDLASVFQVGWGVMYNDVCLSSTRRLLDVLSSLEISDREIQMGLQRLRRELTRHLEQGAPWKARDALEVIAMLDLPAWAALLALIAECPVMLANVSASGDRRPRTVDPAVFEFISENSHIMAVRAFVQALPDALTR
jgi:hypothetical protein